MKDMIFDKDIAQKTGHMPGLALALLLCLALVLSPAAPAMAATPLNPTENFDASSTSTDDTTDYTLNPADTTITVTGDGTNTYTLSGIIDGTGNLIKTGSGTLALTNLANTYTGGTIVNGGVVELASNKVSATEYQFAFNPDSLENAVSGSNSVLKGGDYFFIGYEGNGALSVTNGGQVSSGEYFALGFKAGSSGTVTVSGAGSTLTALTTTGMRLDIGFSGTGVLTITDGGLVSSDLIVLGFSAGSSGTVTVSGAGSTLTALSAGGITVGNRGTGVLTITDGGQANSQGSILVGYNTNSNGTVTVSGEDSQLNASVSVIIGGGGNGIVNVSDGAKATAGGFFVGDSYNGTAVLNVTNGGQIIGRLSIGASTASGTVTVDGQGSMVTSSSVTVGSGTPTSPGTGVLNVTNGGTVAVQDWDISVGFSEASSGTANVSGAGSTLTAATLDIYVGENGVGVLNIMDGGQVKATLGSVFVGVGEEAVSSGTVTVSGAGSLLSAATSLIIGMGSDGILNVGDGGKATGGAIIVGGHNGRDFPGTGVLNITDGGQVESSSYIYLGEYTGSSGTANVSGAGSTLTAATDLYVGYVGTGVLNIAAGGLVSAGGNISLGTGAGTSGVVTVSGAGSILRSDGNVIVGSTGTIGSGLLAGTGTVIANVGSTTGGVMVYSTGVLSAGDTPGAVGTLYIGTDGENTRLDMLTDSTLRVDVNESGQADLVVVFGEAELASGVRTLTIDLGSLNATGGAGTQILQSSALTTNAADGGTLNNVNFTLNGVDLATLAGANSRLAINAPTVRKHGETLILTTSSGSTQSQKMDWTGGASNNLWDMTSANWTDSGSLNQFLAGDWVVFADPTGATITLTNGGATVSQMDVSAGNWTFNGDIAVVSGSWINNASHTPDGKLNVTGGSATLSGNNSFENGIDIAGGGALTLKSDASAGKAAIANAGSLTLDFDGVFGNVVSGAGSLTKAGADTVALTGENTYGGGTTVNAGTLQIGDGGTTGSITGNVAVGTGASLVFNRSDDYSFGGNITGAGAVSKMGGGTLAVNGTISSAFTLAEGTLAGTGTLNGAVTLNGGTSISPGATGTIGALNMGDGGTVTFSGVTYILDVGASNTSDTITVTGTAVVNGGKIDLASWQAGTYTILTATNTVSGTISLTDITLNGAALGSQQLASIDYSTPGSLILTLTGASLTLTWNSSTPGGIWNTLTSNTVWHDGATDAYFTDNSKVTFTATGAGAVTVASGGVTVDTMTVTAGGYTFVEGAIRGDTLSLEATGTSTTTFANAIDFNDITVNANNTIAFFYVLNATNDDPISGAGGLLKQGSGTLTLTGANTYTGGTTVSGGTLQIGDGTTTGSITGNVAVASGSTLAFNRSDAVTYGGAISGAGNLAKNGTGNLTLSGAHTYTGNTTVNDGTLTVTGTLGSGGSYAGAIANAGALVFNQGAAQTLSGNITGAGSLTKQGANTLILTGANTYSGGTTVSGGTLQIGAGGTTGSISGNIINDAAVVFNRSDDYTYEGLISGTGTVTKTGAGMLVLAYPINRYSGGTTVAEGVLRLVDDRAAGTGAVVIDEGADLHLVFSGSFSNDISGDGEVFAASVPSYTITLTGANTYTGGTTVVSGIFQAGAVGAFSSNSVHTLNGTAVLDLADINQTIAGLASASADTSVLLGMATLTVNQATNQTFAGVISGTGGLTKNGTGTLTLTGTNTYGDTTVSAGTLSIASDGNIGAGTNTLSGGTLLLTGALYAKDWTLTGTSNGIENAGEAEMRGILSGAGGGFTKTGAGMLTLAGSTNSYSGGTTVAEGVLRLMNANAAGTGAVVIDEDAELRLVFSGNFGNDISGSGEVATAGTLTLTGTNTYSGGTTVYSGTFQAGAAGAFSSNSVHTLNGTAVLDLADINQTIAGLASASADTSVLLGTATLTVNQATDQTFAGVISGTGDLTKNGTGTLTLSGENTYAGNTTIGTDSYLTVTGTLGTGGTYAGNIDSAGTLTFNQSGAQTLSGAISGDGSLFKDGTGTLTLSGANTYTGDTTIFGGGLTIIGSLGGGTYVGSVANQGALTFSQSADQTVSGLVTSTGSLVKNGTNTLTLAGGLNRNAQTTTMQGTVTINGGTLAIAGQDNYATEVSVASGASLSLTAGATAALNAATLTFSAGGGLNIGGSTADGLTVISTTSGISGFDTATVTVGGGTSYDYMSLSAIQDGNNIKLNTTLSWNLTDGTQHGTFTLTNAGDSYTVGQVLADNTTGNSAWDGRTLTKKGAGTLTLSGANTYTGDTNIQAGTLQIGDGTTGSLGNGNYAGDIANAGTLIFNQSAAQILSGNITGAGSVEKMGTGTLTVISIVFNPFTLSGGTLAGTGTLIGAVTLASGTSVSPGGNGATGTLSMGSGTTSFNGVTYLLDVAATNYSDKITVTGTANVAGGKIDVASWQAGTYTILTAGTVTGTISASDITLNGGAFGSRQDVVLNSSNGTSLVLTLSADALALTWNGVSGNTWNNDVDTNNVWTRNDNSNATYFRNNDSVTFAATGAGTVNVASGGVTVDTMKVTANGYTFAGGAITGNTLSLEATATSTTTFRNAINFTGGISVAANNTIAFDYTASVTNANNITGAGSLAKQGTGTLTLTGTNDYTGGTTISSGTLQIGAGSTSGSISGNIDNGSNVAFNRSDSYTYTGVISGGGNLLKQGSGTLTLTGANTYTGNTVINTGGGLTVTGSLGSGNYAGVISNSSTLTFNQTAAQSLSGQVTGAGSLIKDGANTLTLAGGLNRSAGSAATAGNVTVNDGILAISGLGNYANVVTVGNGAKLGLTAGATASLNATTLTFGATGGLDISGTAADGTTIITTTGGVFGFNAANVTVNGGTTVDYLAIAATQDGNNIKLNTTLSWNLIDGTEHGTFTLTNAGDSFIVAQVLEDKTSTNGLWDGQTLTKDGAGTLILTAANTYSGGTIISDGTLQIGAGGTTGSIADAGGVAVDTGATLAFNRSDNLTYGGVISGQGNLTKQGGGTLTLTGTNTYGGSTTVTGGLINFAASSLGSTGTITLDGGGLQWASGNTTDVSARLNAIGAGGATFDTNGNIVIFATGLSGTGGLTKTGAGGLILSGANTYMGDTIVSAGTLQIQGSITGDVAVAGGATLEFFSSGATSFGGVISGDGSLGKYSSGTLTLSGVNTYTGGTAVADGLVNFNSLDNFGTGNITLSGGGLQWAAGNSADVSGRIVLGAATFDTNGNDVTFANALTGGGFIKTGSGSLTLNASSSLASVNLTTGTLNVASGASLNTNGNFTVGNGITLGLALGDSAAVTTGGTFSIGTGATLNITGYTYSETAQILVDGSNNGAFNTILVGGVATGGTSFLDVVLEYNAADISVTSGLAWNRTDGTAHGNFDIASGESFTLNLDLANNTNGPHNTYSWDGQSLTKTGGGTLVLTGNNTYDGDTTVSAGFLSIAGDTNIGNGANTLDGGTLLLTGASYAKNWTLSGTNNGIENAGDAEMSGVLSGAGGGFTKTGAGTLTLSGTNTHDAGTTVAEGILRLANANAAGTGAVDTAADTALELAFNGSLNNDISGNGEVIADAGAGNTATLAGMNTYTGMTTVKTGTLALGSDLTSSSGLTLYEGTTFRRGAFAHDLSGKTLTVFGDPTYDGDLNAANSTMNFITAGPVTDTMLNVTGTADVTGSNINVGVSGGYTLSNGDTLSLLKAAGGLTGTVTQGNGSGVLQVGATIVHNLTLATTANEITATVGGGSAAEQAKSLSEGYLGGMIMILQGADLVAGQGMDSALSAVRTADETMEGYNIGAFAAGSGGSIKYDTGSHVDMHSVSMLTGLALGLQTDAGKLTLGAFFEYGNGSYDTHNSFSNAASVDGDGNTWYLGGGLLGRMDFARSGPGHAYVEASARAGNIRNDYDSSDLRDASGRKAQYETSSVYYGMHLGVGYVFNISEKLSFDLHGKYFWTHEEGDSATLSTGEHVNFDSVNSHRLRLGSSLSYEINQNITTYASAAWEYEFDGRANATSNGFAIDAPDLKGSTGIGEVGLTIKPWQELPLSVDLGVQGYVGQREGVTGSLRISLGF